MNVLGQHQWRTCTNCGHRLSRNPDKPKKWIHKDSASKKCHAAWDVDAVANPKPPAFDPLISMVMVGNTIYRRQSAYFVGGMSHHWSSWKQGDSLRTTEDLFNMGQPVYPVTVGDKPL